MFSKLIEELHNFIIDNVKNKEINVEEIINDIKDSSIDNMNIEEIYEYFSLKCISYVGREPDFDKISVHYILKKLYLNINLNDYTFILNELMEINFLSSKYIEYCKNNIEFINNLLNFENDKLINFFGLKTLLSGYLLKNKNNIIIETPQHMFLREAIQVNITNLDNNLIKETYYYLSNLYYTHATPTLFNSGSKYPQLSSCYLLQCGDSIDEIGKSISDMMKISKWAGGIGINLSDVRSKGSKIKSNNGKSDGIIPLCKVIETVAIYVNQSGKRKGAIACYLEPWHGDIFSFIDLRRNIGNELERTRDLFLGLWIPDLFMKCVQTEKDGEKNWYLMSSDVCEGLTDSYGEKFEELYYKYVDEGKYIKQVSSKELYNKILESQIETGMPYFLYKDSCNEKSNQKNLGTIKNSNLCVAGNTHIITSKGFVEIKNFADQKINVWNGYEFTSVEIKKTGNHQTLHKIEFDNGEELYCTPYHKFYIQENEEKKEIRADDLKNNMEIIDFHFPYLEGSNHYENTYFVGIQYAKNIIKKNKYHSLNHLYDTTLYSRTQFLQGFFDECSSYKNICKSKYPLIEIKKIINTMGMDCKIMMNSDDCYNIYFTQKNIDILTKNYNFNICRIDENAEKVNIIHLVENEKIKVVNIIKNITKEDTYCFNDEKKHLGVFNGIVTGNCSEIVEYSSNDEIAVCNLASISLPKFVNDNKQFDFELLGKITELSTFTLNNVIDVNFYPVEETKNSNFKHRPIGLGVQGLIDTYQKMGYSFDSIEAMNLNKKIFECIYYHSIKKSIEIAKKDGHYSSFKGSPFSEGKLQFHLWNKNVEDLEIENMPSFDWNNIINDIQIYGTRNSLLTAIMPTGSTSQIMGNYECIEPYSSNILIRTTGKREFIVVNKNLIQDLKDLNLWNNELYNELLFFEGSVQKMNVPDYIKKIYKTSYELQQKFIVQQSLDRGIFIDQSQSLNTFLNEPDKDKLSRAHFYGWKNGIKTGLYYLRTKPAVNANKFGIDVEKQQQLKKKLKCNDEVCLMCSA